VNTPQEIFEKLTENLPKFDDGRINFTGVRKAPVLNVIVWYNGEILIVKRSDKVSAYQGLWNGISGFIDEPKPIEEFAKQELTEELGIVAGDIDRLVVCKPYEVNDKKIDRIWFVYPVLAKLNRKPQIILDWEHTDFAWIAPSELDDYEYVQDFDKSVQAALS
jgi:8-oxo-dGTP pyrophosphatase MutT (NUDIX family)